MKRLITVLFQAVLGLAFSGSSFAGGPGDFVSQQIANQVSRTTSANINKNLADRLIIPQLKIRNESGEVKDVRVSADEGLISLLHEDGTLRVWDTRLGIQRPFIKPRQGDFTHAVPITGREWVVAAEKKGSLTVYDVLTGKLARRLTPSDEAVTAMAVAKDEATLFAAYENGKIDVWRLADFSKITTIVTPYDDDIRFLVPEGHGERIIIAGEGGFVDRWDVHAGKKVAVLADDIDDVAGIWRNPVNGGVAFADEDGMLYRFERVKRRIAENLVDDLLDFAVDDSLAVGVASVEDGGLRVYDLNNIELKRTIPFDRELFHVNFVDRGRRVLAADRRGILYLFDVATGRQILQMISTQGGWTIVDDHGRFDSSENGMINVSWEAEQDDIPLDNFSATYYEPGLLANHLEEEGFINREPAVIQQGIKLPPHVKIIVPDDRKLARQPIMVTVEIQGMGGGVGAVNFYHNGKILGTEALIDSREEIIDNLVKKTLRFRVVPTAGDNQFKATAANRMGIERDSEVIQLAFPGENQLATLHILTVGINQYQDTRLNLDYSVADAEAIASIFGNRDLVAYDEVKQHKLRDSRATKEAITEELIRIARANQQDVLAIYLAGHGIAVDGEWYFMPHETMLQDNLLYYTQVGLSATEIKKILVNARAQRIVILVDSCFSGAGLHAFRKLQDSQRHFSRSLSKTVGLVIMTATRKDQEAAELVDLGHGLFTYVVAEGLSGQADLRPKNKRISAHEVADFSVQVIPEFSRKYLGASQEPNAFMMGKDFSLLTRER